MKLHSREAYKIVKETTLQDKGEKDCPFCNRESQREYILWEWKYWYIQHNKYPLAGIKEHLLALPYRCERFTKDLRAEEWAEYKEVETFMYDYYSWKSYFSFIREIGNEKSIHHLHYHFLPGEMKCPPLISMLREQGIKNTI